ICHWSFVTGHLSLVMCHWSFVTGHWSLVTSHWSLVTGHWSLVTGHWSLVSSSDQRPLVDALTTHIRRAHNAKQLTPSVRCNVMPMGQAGRIDDETRIRVPDNQVGVVAWRDEAFSSIEAGQTRRLATHPPRELLDRDTTLPRTGPHRREGNLERRDAAPRSEIITVRVFHPRRARRVIR